MTYKLYRKSKNVLYLLTIPSILLWQFGGKISWLRQHPLFTTVIFYAICVLFISILYFGIYAHVLKIKTVNKTDSPIILIIFGSLLTLLSYGPPIALHFSHPDITIKPLSSDRLQRLSKEALDPTQKHEDRLCAAKLYYREIRELIEYLDLYGKRAFYSPDGTDKKYLEKRQYLENLAIGRKTTSISLLALAVVSCVGFLILLTWKSRTLGSQRDVCK